MNTFQRFVSQSVFFLQILLLFLLIFQHKVSLPSWLEVGGRMHPLLLHLPIGMLVAFGLAWWLKPLTGGPQPAFYGFLLTLSTFTCSLTALAGFFLSREGGYDPGLLRLHQWFGVGFSFSTWGLWWLYQSGLATRRLFDVALALSLVLMTLAGHFGAGITHGENYLLEPVLPEKAEIPLVVNEETPMFQALVLPVLNNKCTGCHNEKKAKGELVMTHLPGLLKGGKTGPLWVAGDPGNSLLLQRISLPEAAKKHMPPSGKPQLTTEEAAALHHWIKAGADLEKPIKAYPPADTLRLLVASFIQKNAEKETQQPVYAFKPAPASVIRKLNNPFLSVAALAYGSPALQADFSVRQMFDRAQLEKLKDVDEQLVDLNLAYMPVSDQDIRTLLRFPNLESLNLNNTEITGENLAELKALKNLSTLSLAGTAVQKPHIEKLGDFPALKEVYLWNTRITAADSLALSQAMPDIRFYFGYEDPGTPLKLPVPILENESDILSPGEKVELKHYMPGVKIRYTTDGSVPDSLNGPVYESPFTIEGPTLVKTQAVKDGWYASPVAEFFFFENGVQPDKMVFLSPPNEKYRTGGATALSDQVRGTINNFTLAWIGFRETPFVLLCSFEKETPELNSFVMSYGVNVGSYIMPPVEVQVWGGDTRDNLVLLASKAPAQYTAADRTKNGSFALMVDFPAGKRKFYKITATPLGRLPDWHPGKGDKGWIFTDEVFFYGK